MKTIIKRIQRQKLVAAIKIVSLGVGLACSLTLFYLAINFLSTDNFYRDKDKICQVFLDFKAPNYRGVSSTIFQPIAAAMMNDLSHVQYGTTVRNAGDVPFIFDRKIIEASAIYADSLFFKVFERPFVFGNKGENLTSVNTAVITCSYAKKMFGKTDVLGETLNMGTSRVLNITGVIADWPQNSSFKPEVIVSFETLRAEKKMYMGWGGGDSFNGYIKLSGKINTGQLESTLPDFFAKYMNLEKIRANGYDYIYKIIPITKAPFLKDKQLKSTILIFSLLGGLLLVLVCFNANLLSISQLQKMQKELYIRRMQGSSKMQIFKLILFDAIFQFSISLVVSYLVLQIVSPIVLAYFKISLFSIDTSSTLLLLLLGITFILFIAIFIIPVQWSLRQITKQQNKINLSRNSLISDIPLALQVGISFTLLVFFWFIFKQSAYIQNFDKGYNSNNLAFIELNNDKLYSKSKLLKKELENIPGVTAACLSNSIPIWGLSGNMFTTHPNGKNRKGFRNFYVDSDFFSTLQVEIQGQGFSKTSNHRKKVVVTQLAAKELGFDNPINQTIYGNGESYIITGVVSDIVYSTIHTEKQGIIFNYYDKPDVNSTLTFNIGNKLGKETIKSIKSRINEIIPNTPFQIKYYNTELKSSYERDYAIRKAVAFFAIVAVLLTMSGIVGYSLNSIQKRVKEIGIRKINGASEWSLLKLLNRNFVLKSIVALLLFIPVAWWLVNTWIQDYAFHVPVNVSALILISFTITIVVFITITIAVWENVKRNPVEALRYE